MMKDGTNTSFGALKQIDAGLLNVGYAEAGKSDGPAVVLLHGWPYDIHSFVDVAPRLAQAGYRVIVPSLRGYGTTRFLSSTTPRNGQQSVIAVDILALMDALRIEQAILGGFDWGARTADIIAALFPERCKALVSVSGYLIGSQAAGQDRPLDLEGVHQREDINCDHRLLAIAGGVAGKKARCARAAQIGDDHPVARLCKPGRHVDIAVNVVGPTVQQHDRRTIALSSFRVADIQEAGIDLFQRTEGRARPVPHHTCHLGAP